MDEIMIKLKTGIMKSLAEKLLAKALGNDISIALEEMEITTNNSTETYVINVEGSIFIPKKKLMNILTKANGRL